MNLMVMEGLKKSYGERILFENISFGINEGDKIGVIGVNGTGKSTLLKIVAGKDTSEGGKISSKNGIKIGYLEQTPIFKKGTSVIEYVFSNALPQKNMYILSRFPNNAEAELSQNIESQSDAKTILTKLGIKEFEKDVTELSGGQKKRVALACALISDVDLLILDEPTNHIDNETIEWLEGYLKKCTKALLMVTHDRYFLDRVANKTIELDKGRLYTYMGGYTEFLEKKAEREELENANERKRQNFLRTELQWVKRGAKARTTKQKARLERFEQISNVKAPEKKSAVEMTSMASRLGRKTIEARNISKSYDGKTYVDNFSYIVLKDDRIGIIGSNGKGKTTLLNMLCGKLAPDEGEIEVGETVKLGIFSQESTELPNNMRVIDFIKEEADYIQTPDGKISASVMAEKFLFTPDMQYSFISKLSGGEKRRLHLLRVLMSSPNILFLDEPTNDLDIETLTILEEYIDSFKGAVITVSHDRYFLDKCVNRIFAFENGGIKMYEGGYSDYTEKLSAEIKKESENKRNSKQTWDKGEKKLKMTYNEQREFETIGDRIEKLENKIAELENEMVSSSSNYSRLTELENEKNELETELEKAMDRWVYLSELDEKIKNQ